MRRLSAVLCAAIVAPAVLSATPAHAVDTPLPIGPVNQIVADPAHDHVFLSSGKGANGVIVSDTDGVVERVIPGLPGASGMALSEDGSRLFVALADGDAVAMVDTTDLSVKKFPTGPGTCPGSVAFTSGLVWFASTCDDQWAELGAIDPGTGKVTTHLEGASLLYGPPSLAAAPGTNPGVLVANNQGISSGDLVLYRAEATPVPHVVTVAERDLDNFGLGGLRIFDNAVYGASGSGGKSYGLSDLSSQQLFPAPRWASNLAVRGDGMVAVASDSQTDQVLLYQPEDETPVATYDMPEGADVTAMGFGASRLFVTSKDDGHSVLHVYSPPPPVELSVTALRSTASYGEDAHVSVTLGETGTSRAVTLYSTVDGVRREVGSGDVPSSGRLDFVHPVVENTVFSAVFAGDDDHSSAIASTTVKVPARLTSTMADRAGRSGNYAVYHAGSPATLHTRMQPARASGCMPVRVQLYSARRGWHTLSTRCVTMDADGNADRVVRDHRESGTRLRLRAEWPGDDRNTAVIGAWHYARFVD